MRADFYQRMLDTAMDFFLAGERCNLPMKFGNYESHSLAASIVSNYALSIELALKLLASKNGIPELKWNRVHNLATLFEILPPIVREEIQTEASASFNVEKFVDEIAKTFVDWRYPFEKDFLYADTSNMRRLFIACHAVIRKSHPTLIGSLEQKWGSFNPDSTWIDYEIENS